MRSALQITALLCGLAAPIAAQEAPGTQAPDECFRFAFGAWSPSLKTVANLYNPGTDPTASAARGAPRDWAARESTGAAGSDAARDSVLMLFPAWWPSGVSIEWTESRGDTLVGVAHAFVADGRIQAPVTNVRGLRIPCARPPASDVLGVRP